MNAPHSNSGILSSRNLFAILFVLSVFLISTNRVHDPDAWLHLSHGKLLWEEKALPDNEVFTYPNADDPHLYTSWTFGFICYVSYMALGEYGPGILKAVLVAIAFLIIFRDSIEPYRNHALAAALLTGIVLLSQYRFVLRPDILLMSFLPLSIFCLNAYLYQGKKYIYALPFVHLLWANCHSSINLMAVPFFAFIIGGLIQKQLAKRGFGAMDAPSASQLRIITAIFAASVAASLINPNFIDQHLFGYKVLSIDWWRTEIVELQPASGREAIILFVSYAIILLSFIQQRFSIIHILIVIPFMFLPFTAIRFKYIFAITAGPIFVRNLSALIESKGWSGFLSKKVVNVTVSTWIVIFTILALANVSPFGIGKNDFGFKVDDTAMPRGAVEYMDRKNIYGRVLNPFQYGQYIIWKSYPKRTVFVDGRGHIQEELLYRLKDYKVSNFVLDEFYKAYGFEAIILQQPITSFVLKASSHSHGENSFEHIPFSHLDWALVYWDDISYLYLNRNGKHNSALESDEYKHIRFGIDFMNKISRPLDEKTQEDITAELRRNINETGSSIAHALLGLLQSSNGRYSEAIDSLSNVKPGANFSGLINLERIAFVISGDSHKKLGDLDKSIHFYNLSLGIREDENVLNKIGEIHFMKGLEAYSQKEYRTAISEFNESLKTNPSNPVAYTNMGYIYYDMNQLDKAYEYFNKAIQLSPKYANAYYGLGLVFKKRGDMQSAKKYFKKYLEIEPSGTFSNKAQSEMKGM
jgi:tetratricopeptide (TPR) repeat protein